VSRGRYQRIALLGVSPPPAGSSRADRLRFVRDLQVRWLAIYLPAIVLVAIVGPRWAVVLEVVALVSLIADIGWLSAKITSLTNGDR